MNRTKKESQTPVSSTDQLLERVLTSLDELKALVSRPITTEAPTLRDPLPTNEPTQAPELVVSYPVPADYRHLVDSILNKEFGVEMSAHPDAPIDTVTIVVPDKYSPATPDQKASVGGRDIRPKIISRAGGVNELKEWVELIYKNFAPEVQAMIVADRSK